MARGRTAGGPPPAPLHQPLITTGGSMRSAQHSTYMRVQHDLQCDSLHQAVHGLLVLTLRCLRMHTAGESGVG